MIVEFAIVAGLGLGGWVLTQLFAAPKAPPAPPAKIRAAAKALKEGTATAAQLHEAAKVAEVAGDYELAERFASRAVIYGAVEDARREATRRSPLAGVADEAWRKFVAAARVPDAEDEPDYVSPRFRLGLYGLDARTLTDIRVMQRPRRGEWQGHEVWLADWAPSAAGWLENPEAQYVALAKLTRLHADTITKKHAAALGQELEPDAPATLSGLLAVARLAGLGGLSRFLSAADERFPNTLRAYRASNGIF